ncbi:hypothetical protein [Nostoc sp. CHAB 5715]|uniref:hypothetical protein n=1 Tax=Nostoc sp. CHAB 5715 TaxID=2780400 RepID=UPI001E2B8549|nr:hypothetical protein [Nostoc sp. CHAB 5715]MCC5621890.1 hypothetical protein [Nostoc sp. CHAB 5715]
MPVKLWKIEGQTHNKLMLHTTQLLCVHVRIHELANIAFIYYKLWALPGKLCVAYSPDILV